MLLLLWLEKRRGRVIVDIPMFFRSGVPKIAWFMFMTTWLFPILLSFDFH